MIRIDLSKQHTTFAERKVIQKLIFTGNRERAGNTKFFFILKEGIEIIFDTGNRESIVIFFLFNIKSMKKLLNTTV